MSKKRTSKRVRSFIEKWGHCSSKPSSLNEVMSMVEDYRSCSAKFDESIDLCIELGIDKKKTEQTVKTNVTLPHSFGKKASVLVIADGKNATSAKELGVEHVGMDDVVSKVVEGKLVPGRDFTACVATKDGMLKLSKSKGARILGVMGMMPNVKNGTVAEDIVPVLKEIMSGRIEIRSNKVGFVKLSIGKISFSSSALRDNIFAVYEALKAAKPTSLKGSLFSSARISSSMMGTSFGFKLTDLYAKNS